MPELRRPEPLRDDPDPTPGPSPIPYPHSLTLHLRRLIPARTRPPHPTQQ